LAVLAGADEVMRENSIAVRRGKFIDERQIDDHHLGFCLDVAKCCARSSSPRQRSLPLMRITASGVKYREKDCAVKPSFCL